MNERCALSCGLCAPAPPRVQSSSGVEPSSPALVHALPHATPPHPPRPLPRRPGQGPRGPDTAEQPTPVAALAPPRAPPDRPSGLHAMNYSAPHHPSETSAAVVERSHARMGTACPYTAPSPSQPQSSPSPSPSDSLIPSDNPQIHTLSAQTPPHPLTLSPSRTLTAHVPSTLTPRRAALHPRGRRALGAPLLMALLRMPPPQAAFHTLHHDHRQLYMPS